MTKYIPKTMDMADWVLDVRVNYKKAVLLIFFLKKLFC